MPATLELRWVFNANANPAKILAFEGVIGNATRNFNGNFHRDL